ncbi:MAG: hypothetical protein GY716_09285 [bacterium]|nr:hypothetical protein [bacterium]
MKMTIRIGTLILLLSLPAAAGAPPEAFYSPATPQVAGGILYPQNLYESPSGDVFLGSFLPSSTQIDAASVVSDDSFLFSTDKNAVIGTPGGVRFIIQNQVWRATATVSGVELMQDPQWAALGLNLRTLDALAHTGNGCFAFSVAQAEFGPGGILRPAQVHHKCPGQPAELLFDAAASFRVSDVDAVHIDGDVVEFSIRQDQVIPGRILRNQNTYRCEPAGPWKTCSAAALEDGFSGVGAGVRDLNAYSARVDVVTSTRAVDQLGTTAAGPTGVNPVALGGANGGAGNPPASGNIADGAIFATNFWDFDYIELNEGAFNDTVQLTDASGANVGNPVVLFSAGHDYTGFDPDPVGPCDPVDTFQVVLEATIAGALFDVAAPSTPVGPTDVLTTWISSDPGVVSVSNGGLLTAVSENACTTISWSIAAADPALLEIEPSAQSGSFAACVDSGGVDTATRTIWLPFGDLDANLPGLPSGPPQPRAGENFGVTWIVNTGTAGLGALSARTEYMESVIDEDQGVDTRSVGGSPATSIGLPFAVNASVPGQTRWNDVDAFASASGIFPLFSQTYTATAAGTTTLLYQNEELADGAACTIWLDNPCMPFSASVCSQPGGGYPTIAGSGTITVLP